MGILAYSKELKWIAKTFSFAELQKKLLLVTSIHTTGERRYGSVFLFSKNQTNYSPYGSRLDSDSGFWSQKFTTKEFLQLFSNLMN